MFFMLSGFVITHVYQEGIRKAGNRVELSEFSGGTGGAPIPAARHGAVLFVATAIAERAATYALRGSFEPIPLVGERSLSGFFANLLMLQGLWARELNWNDPAWSISVEFLAYMLFPLLFPLSGAWAAVRAQSAGCSRQCWGGWRTARVIISTSGTEPTRWFGACQNS